MEEARKPAFGLSLGMYFLAALVILALNLYWIGPKLTELYGQGAGNGVFIALRVICVIGLSFVASAFFGKTRYQAIRLASILEFFDHVVFKAGMLYLDFIQLPQNWEGASFGTALFGLLFSFILFFPVIFILAFLGSELGRQKSKT